MMRRVLAALLGLLLLLCARCGDDECVPHPCEGGECEADGQRWECFADPIDWDTYLCHPICEPGKFCQPMLCGWEVTCLCTGECIGLRRECPDAP
jgi:hypothetical protein